MIHNQFQTIYQNNILFQFSYDLDSLSYFIQITCSYFIFNLFRINLSLLMYFKPY